MSKRVITLGTWNGNPIEWIVLKEDGFQTLVVSKWPLFSSVFNRNDSDGNRWDSSALRNYLNSSFYQSAFDENEKKKIISAYLSDPNGTKDNVFVLSVSEAENLMTQNERAYGDKSCNRHGQGCSNCYQYSRQYGTCWWLRNLYTGDSRYANYIDCHGNSSNHYVYNMFSIRPAMYVKE